MSRVLILATSPKTKGGISSVIKAHQKGPQWQTYNCKWIATHIDKGVMCKAVVLLKGFIEYVFFLPGSDLIHIHISEPTTAKRKLPFFRLAKLFKKKIIIHFHSFSPDTTINGPHSELYKTLFCGADAVVVLSNYWKEAVNNKFQLGERVKVIYNPCIDAEYNEVYEKENSILYAGALNQRKGYSDLIKAFSMVSEKFPMWKISFAGNGEIEEARSLAENLGILNQVELLGWVSGKEKDRAYKKATVFCLPSYAEGFPMAVLDAWAYGLPVITTPVGGIPDIAQDGQNMLLFKPGDTKQLADCIERMICGEGLRKTMAEESLRLSQTTFNINTIDKQVGDLYAEVLNKVENTPPQLVFSLSYLHRNGGYVLHNAA